MAGTSSVYFNANGVASQFSLSGVACVGQCMFETYPGQYVVDNGGIRRSSTYYHDADAVRINSNGATPSDDGFRTCTPE